MNLNAVNNEIHMYIAGEEVVCDKEIVVAEKLLNTNSTALYNCYPLSWEQDKDYVSRFYFPKDYSKFELVVNGITAFRGVIKRSKPVNLSPFQPHWATLQVLDYKTFLSEGNQLNFVLKDVTIRQAIEQILEAYDGYNFVVGNLNIGDKKKKTVTYSFSYRNLVNATIRPVSIETSVNHTTKAEYIIGGEGVFALYDAQNKKAIPFLIK